MAWEDRNGTKYYYRKRWVNGHVVSEYVGSGYYADLAARFDDLIRAEQARAQTEQQKAHADFMDISRQVDQVSDRLRSVTRAALLSAGYYLHRGQWRRRRE